MVAPIFYRHPESAGRFYSPARSSRLLPPVTGHIKGIQAYFEIAHDMLVRYSTNPTCSLAEAGISAGDAGGNADIGGGAPMMPAPRAIRESKISDVVMTF